MYTFLETTRRRFAALTDGSAWLLMLPALLVLWVVDPPMVKTLLQWTMFFLVVSGLSVMVSRVCFPQIDLNSFLVRAYHGDKACALVVAAVIAFVAALIIAIVLWARPLG